MNDWSGDVVLKALQDLEEPVGSLIRAFPGRAAVSDEPYWLNEWFLDLAKRFAGGKAPDPKKIVASAADRGDLSLLAKPAVKSQVRLTAIRPHFFRGFRAGSDPIRLDADLVVIEGRNSSGKTSLSEAIEWVLTGQLSRRTSGQFGHARELADCISNEFKPEDSETSVELELTADAEPLVLKRILSRDYSTTASDEPVSELFVNGNAVTADGAAKLMDVIFAGVHPILMQHNLRRFVHDDPTSRRQYFERLLQIDELTALIEKAVIGPAGLKQIVNPAGGAGLAALMSLTAEMTNEHSAADLKKLDRLKAADVPASLDRALVSAAKELFSDAMREAKTLGQCREILFSAQRMQREARLPLLSELESSCQQPVPTRTATEKHLNSFREAAVRHSAAQSAAEAVSEAEQELARITQRLIDASLIKPPASKSQLCPVCNDPSHSLTVERLEELLSWAPLTRAVDSATTKLRDEREKVAREIAQLVTTAKSAVPLLPETQEILRQLSSVSQGVQGLAKGVLVSAAVISELAGNVVNAAQHLEAAVAEEPPSMETVDETEKALYSCIEVLLPGLASHREDVTQLEDAVGAASRDDTSYRVREKWLELAGLIISVAEDIAWERSKASAKGCLDGLREGLIALRTEIIEQARQTFSDRMTEMWHLLRSDSGAWFSQLSIPTARGKGYKLEFELKAVISDSDTSSEVDALRVFSESQVNVVGLAAYVTRAKLLGHKLLIFDDPVQSMDEEHFRSFAGKLLPSLVDEGFQVVILTHSDAFARRIHDNHYDRLSYATLETRATKKLGCQVIDGNRRVSERLKNAERIAADGDLQNGWRLVRVAIERLYTLIFAKANPDFDAETWRNMTADDMWNRGVGELIEKVVPGAGKRLKEILTSTLAGAHDKAATSETDLVDAAKYLRGLLSPLRLGAG